MLQTALTGGVGDWLALADEWRGRLGDRSLVIERLCCVDVEVTGWLRLNRDGLPLEGVLRFERDVTGGLLAELAEPLAGGGFRVRLAVDDAGRPTLNGRDLAALRDLLAAWLTPG